MSQTYSFIKDDIKYTWEVEPLWRLAEGKKSVEWEIPSDFLSSWHWGLDHISDHIERCLDVDLSYPILVHNNKVVDGTHRSVKALSLGKSKIRAIVLDELPEPKEDSPKPEDVKKSVYWWTHADLVQVLKSLHSIELENKYKFRHPIDGI